MEYSYLGYTGDRQVVKGKVSAADERSAVDMLSNIGYRVVSLKPASRFLSTSFTIFKPKVKIAEMVTFSRQMALLLESGVGIIQALELLQTQGTDKNLKNILAQVVHDLKGGKSLSMAMAQHPQVFNKMYCKLVNVGEQTGSLETVLRSLAGYIERQSASMAKLRQAMLYPTIVFFLGIAVAVVMLTVLMPPMIAMFSSLGGTLPLPTRILLGLMSFLQHYGAFLFIGIIILAVIGFLYSRTAKGRYQRDILMLRIPLIGRLNLVTELARICRSLSILFKAGLPLTEVMSLTIQSTGNRVLARSLGAVEQGMLRGQGLAKPMSTDPVFLPMMVEMAKVGEETGNLDDSLTLVSENFEIEADRRTQTLLSMIEPVMTIAMGLGVGFLALAVFMPIYSSLSLIK
jgi:type IV pilus assembly protein PilC